MLDIKKTITILIIISLFFIVGCSNKEDKKPEKSLLKGVSLSPISYNEKDFSDFFVKAKEAGSVVMWAGDWKELEEGAAKVTVELASEYNYIPLIEATHYIQSEARLIRPFDEEAKQEYLNAALGFARKYEPPYLGFGIEVNIIYENSPEDFQEFVSFYNDLYDAIKEVSPSTKVFTIFQLERIKGMSFWIEEPPNKEKEEWFLLDMFKSDIVAFTTYPSIVYKNPSDIPANYYSEIKEHANKPIAFTEIGWHSAQSPLGWESSEDEQALFVERFFNLTKDLNIELVIWSFLFDQETIEPFDTMGLYDRDGKAKKAWNLWLSV